MVALLNFWRGSNNGSGACGLNEHRSVSIMVFAEARMVLLRYLKFSKKIYFSEKLRYTPVLCTTVPCLTALVMLFAYCRRAGRDSLTVP